MPNVSLLVAGTGGITLMDSRGQDLGYPVKMRLGLLSRGLLGLAADELQELLSMDHVPGQVAPAKTSLKRGVSIRPGHVLEVAYNQVPGSFNHFLYDWRADLRHNAALLRDFLVERKPAGSRWNVVGHSQGALLVVLASKLFPNRSAFAEVVASVILVGAPLAGTVNAVCAILEGDQMGEAASPAFRKILRTWPALYQMMPSWPAVVDGADATLGPEEQLLSPSAWTGHDGISGDMLARAREAQTLLRDPLGWMEGDIDVAILMARNRQTGISLRKTDGMLTGESRATELGDSLVPHDRTRRWMGDQVWQFVATFKGVNEHAFLLNDPAIVGEARNRLRD